MNLIAVNQTRDPGAIQREFAGGGRPCASRHGIRTPHLKARADHQKHGLTRRIQHG